MGDRLYSNKHLWISKDNDIATIGLTDFLQNKLGDIMFINLPEVGEKLVLGKRFSDIESKKTVIDIESPVNGEVIAINETLEDEPYLINDMPYESWLVKARVDLYPNDLMSEKDYLERINQPWMKDH